MVTKAPVGTAETRPEPTTKFTPARKAMLQRMCACGSASFGGGCTECKKKQPLQRNAAGLSTSPGPTPLVDRVMSESGQPLDSATRGFMESRFGHDFSQVRIHTDAQAAESARSVDSKAYTVGQDIAFDHGYYDPQTESGKHLLAHELAHTIQQQGLQRSSNGISVDQGEGYQRLEHEAESAADSVMHGGRVTLSPASQPIVSRAGKGGKSPINAKDRKQDLAAIDVEEMESISAAALETAGSTSFKKGLRRYRIRKPFPLPATKGLAKETWQERAKGGGLESLVDISGEPKAALKQERPGTDELRKIWLAKVHWTRDEADEKWMQAGGDKANFDPPQAGKETCAMDHVIELQIGGNNVPANIQVLDSGANSSAGSTVRGILSTQASAIRDADALAKDSEVILHYESVQQEAPTCGPCCKVEQKAMAGGGSADKKTSSEGDKAVRLPLEHRGSPAEILITKDLQDNKKIPVPLRGSDLMENKAASTLVPGLLLETYKRGGELIDASFDVGKDSKTRVPIALKKAPDKQIHFKRAKNGSLTLTDASPNLDFLFGPLSPGRITKMSFDESGEMNWSGYINPTVPFLGRLDVEYKAKELTIKKGLDKSQLKKPFPGVRITEASLGIKLAPEFKPEGKIGLVFGPEAKPLAEAELIASTDGQGFVAEGTLRVLIPGVDKAESKITYKGGGEHGAGSWTGLITIESSQIKLPYIKGGSVIVQLVQGRGVAVKGEVNLELPGENSATVGLQKEEDAWVFEGRGQFKVPKVGEVKAGVRYNTKNNAVRAWAKDISAKFKFLDLSATLKELSCEIQPERKPVFWGAASLDIKKGKAQGRADLVLNRNGKFTGRGTVTYPLRENLIVTGTVILDAKEKLRFEGELLIPKFRLFDPYTQKKNIFSINLPIPIPGLSIGKSGLVAHIRGGLEAGYTFGPGVIEPLKFSAGFSPLEDDPDVELGVSGKLSIPAKAWITAYISGGLALEIDVFIASAGAEAGLTLSGTATLRGEVFANLDAKYKQKKLTATMTAGLNADLIIGAALTAYVMVYAKFLIFGADTRLDWTLAKTEFPTGLQFKLSAPFSYDSDTGIKLPSVDEVDVTKPKLDAGTLLGNALKRQKPKETEL